MATKIRSDVTCRTDRWQLRHLLKINLKLDWRGAFNPFVGYGSGEAGTELPGMVMVMGLTFVMSIFLGLIFFRVPDLVMGLTISGLGATIVIAIQMLLDFGTIIIAPDDHEVIAPHPVNSRTFYYAKLLHLITYVTILSLVVSIVPAVCAAIRFSSPWIFPVVLVHHWLSAALATVLMMNVYTLFMRVVDRVRLERLLGYLQVFLILMVSCSWMLLTVDVMPEETMAPLREVLAAVAGWLILSPSYWFAAPIELASAGWRPEPVVWLAWGLIVIALLARFALPYLSLSYAESLTRPRWQKASRKSSRAGFDWSRLLCRLATPEDRVLWRLVRSYYKNDIKFRLGLLTAIWLPLVYILIALLANGPRARDLFLAAGSDALILNLLFGMLMSFLPFSVVSTLLSSKDWRASWAFFATPVDRTALVRSIIRLTIVIVVLPLGLIIGGAYLYLLDNGVHAVLHTTTLLLFGLTGLAYLSIFVVRLPFSVEPAAGNLLGAMMKPWLPWFLVSTVPVFLLSINGYGGYVGWTLICTALLCLRWLCILLYHRRMTRLITAWEFYG